MRIIFFGTDYYSTLALNYLLSHDAQVIGIVTGTKKGSLPFEYESVHDIATKNNIPTIHVGSKTDLINSKETIQSWTGTIGFVSSFGVIIPREIFEIPIYGTLNLHPSLLPAYRGPSPMEQTILDQQTRTGVTIMRIDTGVDTGNIIDQKQESVLETDTTLSLAQKLYPIGTQMFIDQLSKHPHGDFNENPQINDSATITSRYTKNDARIVWNTTAQNISALVRAYYPKPLAWTTLSELVSHFSNKGVKNDSIEKRVIIHNGIVENDMFTPSHVQLEGKNIIDWKTFRNGYL